MFPHNNDENARISKNLLTKTKVLNGSFIFSVLFAFILAFLLTTIPPLIYFFRLNLL